MMFVLKIFLVLLLIVCTITYAKEDSNTTELNSTDDADNIVAPNLLRNRKLILIWESYFIYKTTPVPRERDQIGDCIITYDKKHLRQASAVVFHHHALNTYNMPWWHYRDEDQLFVWFTDLNPAILIHHQRKDFTTYDNFFNWTMSYRRDSDIFMPMVSYKDFGWFVQTTSQHERDISFRWKSRVAFWLPSLYNETTGARMASQYAYDLIEAGLDLDICGTGFFNSDICTETGITTLNAMTYKFALSFEINRHCKDFITENFWYNAITLKVVPVVWGAKKEDLLHLVPPGSYIHADDFDSPADLAKYLMYLDKNDADYKKYFDWQKYPEKFPPSLKNLHNTGFAQLCKKATQNTKKKTVNISEFLKTDHKECLEQNANLVAHEEL